VEYIRLIVALVITAVWAVTVLAPLFVENIDLPDATPLMLLVATYFLGTDVLQRLRNGNGKSNGAHNG
jgi:hypothetical protein